jgi:hypothetical protein
MKKFFFVLLIGSMFFISCKKDEKIDLTQQCVFYDNFLGVCFNRLAALEFDQFIITDNKAYQTFADSIRDHPYNINCDTATLPTIDFTKYSLLGKKTSGGGCSATYNRLILQDNNEKKLIYKITVQYKGSCSMLLASWNWVIIPKLEKGYSVEFQVN